MIETGKTEAGIPPARQPPPRSARWRSRCPRGLLVAVVLALPLIGSLGCEGWGSVPPAVAEGRPNLLVLSIDTLRADHLGSYGYERPTSPRLDAFAAAGLRYEKAYAPTPWTLPSHAAMLTGVHPFQLGFRHANSTIPDEVPVVAELLAAAGYRTAAFVDSAPKGYVGAERGFSRGFDLYQHAPHSETQAAKYDMAGTVEAALGWLEHRDRRRPFFLFLHTKSVHAAPLGGGCGDPRCFPYEKPTPYQTRFLDPALADLAWSSPELGEAQKYLWSLNERFLDGRLSPPEYPRDRVDALIAYYDAGIAYVDDQFARLLDGLERLGIGDDTVIVVTADHGEAFLEHHLLLHQEVYEPLLHVPLLVRLPAEQAGSPGVVEEPVALEDLVPTLLRWAGVALPNVLTGRLLPAADGGAPTASSDPERSLFAYYLFPPNFTYQAFSQRQGDWKLVSHNWSRDGTFGAELYDLATDPTEREPVGDQAERLDSLQRALRANLRRPPLAQAGAVDESDPALDAIRALGYID